MTIDTLTSHPLAELHHFRCTSAYHAHWLERFVLTDGAHYVREHGGAWIVDAIASWQYDSLITDDESLGEHQFWTLTVNKDKSAVLACARDRNDIVLLQQKIEWTDFPLAELRLWLVGRAFYATGGVLLLPSEY